MASASDLANTTGGQSEDARQKLDLEHDLGECEKRLQAMVDKYKFDPKTIDSGLDAQSAEFNIEDTVREAYRLMSSRVYAEDNPLQLDDNLKKASKAQEDEFDEFYNNAVKALENYREVLDNYKLMKGSAPPRPERGELGRIKDDVHVLTDERDSCIKAIKNFHGKFSAMLRALRLSLKHE
jgi:hypothetical protein